MTILSLESLIQDDVFYELPLPGTQLVVQLKLEGLNPAGSIKFKTALAMIGDLKRSGKLRAGGAPNRATNGHVMSRTGRRVRPEDGHVRPQTEA